jgi:hypothetical protein
LEYAAYRTSSTLPVVRPASFEVGLGAGSLGNWIGLADCSTRCRYLGLNVGSLRWSNLSGVGGKPDSSSDLVKAALMTHSGLAARKDDAAQQRVARNGHCRKYLVAVPIYWALMLAALMTGPQSSEPKPPRY